ncbi:hypothetical protein BD309DRAFT_958727 [Dichomitus squalens]|nr:hypothetical protein BD309DRAFT_958727 [Dichomitus squalens]
MMCRITSTSRRYHRGPSRAKIQRRNERASKRERKRFLHFCSPVLDVWVRRIVSSYISFGPLSMTSVPHLSSNSRAPYSDALGPRTRDFTTTRRSPRHTYRVVHDRRPSAPSVRGDFWFTRPALSGRCATRGSASRVGSMRDYNRVVQLPTIRLGRKRVL